MAGWQNGNDSRPFPSSYDIGSTVGRTLEATQSHDWNQQTGAGSCTDIPLLNDDHEKAILSDLCKTAGTESTPLTTFSYISEYICSNNIDIWPGELPGSSDVSGVKLTSAEHSNIGDQVRQLLVTG